MTDSSSGLSAAEVGWIPLRLGIIAPLAGGNLSRPETLIRVQAGECEAAMERVAPALSLHLTPPAQPAAGTAATEPVEVALRFASFKDFSPRSLLMRVPILRDLAERRLALGRVEGGSPDPARAAELDAQLSRGLDSILHHPAFLDLESAWRGLDFAAARGHAADGSLAPLLLEVLAVGPHDDFLPALRREFFEPDYEDRSDFPLAAVLCDRAFDPQPASVERLREMAGLMNAIQTAFFAQAGPAFFGLKNLAHLAALPDLATRSQGGAFALWNAFQKESASRWLCLTVNRFLLREPHDDNIDLGALFDPETEDGPASYFHYRETVDPAHPEWLCWGNAIWAAAVSLAASYAEHGHCAAADGLSGSGGHGRLPVRELNVTGKTVQCPTEVLLPDDKAWDLCRAGFTPLVGMQNGDTAYFPFLGNVYRTRPGSITLDQALTYQLYAGQFGHVVLRVASGLRGLPPEEAAGRLQLALFAHFSPFVGDAPGERVQVKPITTAEGKSAVRIQVTPTFHIQDKPVELELQLPLE